MAITLIRRDTTVIKTYTDIDDWGQALELAALDGIDCTALSAAHKGTISNRNFSGLKLKGAIFDRTIFINCIFNKCNFTDSTIPTLSYATQIQLSTWSNCKFIKSNFSGTIFNFQVGSAPSFIGCDFTDSQLTETKFFYNVIFTQCNFSNVCFNSIDVIGIESYGTKITFDTCIMKRTNFSSIIFITDRTAVSPLYKFIKCDLERAVFSDCNFILNPFINECNLYGCNFSNSDLSSIIIPSDNRLDYCIFSQANLYGFDISNNLSATNCTFDDTELNNVNFTNTNLSNSSFVSVKFVGDGNSLYNTNLSNCNFTGSDWTYIDSFFKVDLSNADLTDSIINGKNLTTATLTGCNFTNVVLSGDFFNSVISVEAEVLGYELNIAEQKLANEQAELIKIGEIISPYLLERNYAQADVISKQTALDTYTTDVYEPSKKQLSEYNEDVTYWDNMRKDSWNAYNRTAWWDAWRLVVLRMDIYNQGLYQKAAINIANNYYYNTFNPIRIEEETKKNNLLISQNYLNNINNKYKIYFNEYDAQQLVVDKKQGDVDDLIIRYNEAKQTVGNPIYADLRNVNLTNANLTNVDLSHVNMIGVIFTGTILAGAKFDYAILYDADLSTQTSLLGCTFNNTSMSGTTFFTGMSNELKFINADLREAIFTSGTLKNCDFTNSKLTGASFLSYVVISGGDGPNFTGAWMNDTEMPNLDFSYNTKLRGVNLSGSNLTNAILSYTDMRDSKLMQVTMNGADFDNSVVSGCDMERIDLSEANISNSIFTSSNLNKSFMQSINSQYCDFQNTSITGSDMRNGDFSHSKFNYANMVFSDLRDSNFHSNDFSYADLSRVKAYKINFYYPVLLSTKLSFLETQKENLLKAS